MSEGSFLEDIGGDASVVVSSEGEEAQSSSGRKRGRDGGGEHSSQVSAHEEPHAHNPPTGGSSPPHSGGASDCSLLDNIERLSEEASGDLSEYHLGDWRTASETLRNLGRRKYQFPQEIVQDASGVITPSLLHVGTMDGVSKTLQMIPEGDPSQYVLPVDGFAATFVERWALLPFCFCFNSGLSRFPGRCSGVGLPEHILNVLYFFTRLKMHLEMNEKTKYVVPTQQHKLVYKRGGTKEVVGVHEVRTGGQEAHEPAPPVAEERFRLGDCLFKRSKMVGSETVSETPFFSVRVAFTGASYRVGEQLRQAVFCMAIVTPLRNWDMLGYIQEVFLQPPKSIVVAKSTDVNELQFLWRTILQKEAINCGLFEDPYKHLQQPSGSFGFFTITNMLGLPLRIAEMLHARYSGASEIRIIGCPDLSYVNDAGMLEYVRFMNDYISQQGGWNEDMQGFMQAFYALKDEDRLDRRFPLSHPCGWPLRVERGVFLRFGLFPFPLVMWFNLVKTPQYNMGKQTFLVNYGKLPKTVTKKLRDFLTSNLAEADQTIIPDERILTSRTKATPLEVSRRYYGAHANPEDDFKTAGCMLGWFEALKLEMKEKKERGQWGAEQMFVLLDRHVRSCMEHHVGMLEGGNYHSDHLVQMHSILQMVEGSPLRDVDLKGCLQGLWARRVFPSVRHDPFQSASTLLLLCFADYNRDAKLNPANLECMLEIWLSSMHYVMGEGDNFVSFFQGVMIMSCRGHLNLLVNNMSRMLNFKPNTTGCGTIQKTINRFWDMLGKSVGIMPNDIMLRFNSQNRATPVALENMSCLQVVNGVVVGAPPANLMNSPIMSTEIRKQADMTSMILYMGQRDDNEGAIFLSTVDPNNTNQREVAQKRAVTVPNVCAYASNCVMGDAEEIQSFSVVQHVMVPGAPSYWKKAEANHRVNDVQCNQ